MGRRRLAQNPEAFEGLAHLIGEGVAHLAQAIGDHCFPAHATVEAAGRGRVAMEALRYGDRVLARDWATGRLVHREVYLFGHRDPRGVAPFVRIVTDSGAALQLTSRHYVPLCTAGCTEQGLAAGELRAEARYGGEVVPGDTVLVVGSRGLQPSRVVATSWQLEAH